MKKLLLIVVAIASFALLTNVQAAGDKKAGKAKYAICASCHGTKGTSTNPMYPSLAGQHAKYLVSAMKAYKNNERSGSLAAQMQPFASMLNKKDMKNIAAYLSSL